MKNTIEIKNLTKKIKGKDILKNISFTAKEGRITAFLGPNGAGKSSTLRILLGLDKADAGIALIDGNVYTNFKNPLLKVGVSFDGVGAPDERTVFQHLKIIAASNGINYSKIKEVAKITGIEHKLKSCIGTLSLGEGQRLGIATALLGDPQFLIFDEPTNGLDPQGIRWFREFIKSMAQDGKTVLLSSHILSEVEVITDDVVIINRGEILIKGSLKEVLSDEKSLEDVFFKLTEGGK